MHYYSFNIGDYRKDTIHLSRLEHSIYRDLIDWYYLEESPIPTETQSVMRRLRLASESDELALKNVIQDFFFASEDGFRHKRIDQEIADYHGQCDKNRTNGKKGGRPKGKKTQSVSSGLPVVTQTDATANPNQEPLTTNQEPIKKTKQKSALPPFVLPDWINQTHWDAWHSCAKRRKATPEQKALAVSTLSDWRDAGLDYATALQNAAVGGWQGLFLPEAKGNVRPLQLNKQTALEARNRAVGDEWLKQQEQLDATHG
jgi:uncharacterized protein YdaU (DUF1376 family)